MKKAFTLIELIFLLVFITFLITIYIDENNNTLTDDTYITKINENFSEIENVIHQMMNYPNKAFTCIRYTQNIAYNYPTRIDFLVNGFKQCTQAVFPDLSTNFDTKDPFGRDIIMEIKMIYPGNISINQQYNPSIFQIETETNSSVSNNLSNFYRFPLYNQCFGIDTSLNTLGPDDLVGCLPNIEIVLTAVGKDGMIAQTESNIIKKIDVLDILTNKFNELQNKLSKCSINFQETYKQQYLTHGFKYNYFFNEIENINNICGNNPPNINCDNHPFILNHDTNGIVFMNKRYNTELNPGSFTINNLPLVTTTFDSYGTFPYYPTEYLFIEDWQECVMYRGKTNIKESMTGFVTNSNDVSNAYNGFLLYPFINLNTLENSSDFIFTSENEFETNMLNNTLFSLYNEDYLPHHHNNNYNYLKLGMDPSNSDLDVQLKGIIYTGFEYGGNYFND